jgi:hypothetical protein
MTRGSDVGIQRTMAETGASISLADPARLRRWLRHSVSLPGSTGVYRPSFQTYQTKVS